MKYFNQFSFFLLFFILPMQASSHPGFDDEIDHITERIDAEPENAKLYWLRGDVNRIYRHWDRALADFQVARELDKHLYKSDLGIGRSYYDQALYLDAVTYLSRFLSHEPGNIRALLYRARAWKHLGRYQQAAADYTRAINQFQSPRKPTPVFYLERAQALEAAGSSYVDDAIAGLEEGMQLIGPIITLDLYAVELETKRRNYDAALQRMDRIINRSERKDLYLVKRSRILTRAGRPDKARRDLHVARDIIEKLPRSRRNSRAARQTRAEIELGLGALDK